MWVGQDPELVALDRVEHHGADLVRIHPILEDVLDAASDLAGGLAVGFWFGLAGPELHRVAADVGIDRAWAEHRCRHIATSASELTFERCHERDHTVFGHVVGTHHAASGQTGHGRGGIDMAFALFLDQRQEDLDAIDRAPQIDVDDPLPVGEFHLLGRGRDADTCVVAQTR